MDVNLEALLDRAFAPVPSFPFITEAYFANWEKWVRANLGDLLEILPYDNQAFDLDLYMRNLGERLADAAFDEDHQEDRENFLAALDDVFAYLPTQGPPTSENIQFFMEGPDNAFARDEHLVALYLVYAYHLRRSHHRADEHTGPEIPPPPMAPPPPVVPADPLPVGTFGLEAEEKREKVREDFVNGLRTFATHKINWNYESRKKAIAVLERQWASLDKFSQRDLESLWSEFKHDCGPI